MFRKFCKAAIMLVGFALYASMISVLSSVFLSWERLFCGVYSARASSIFFAISNFGVWFMNPFYAQNFQGLLGVYVAGIPFFPSTVLGDAFFTVALFGLYQLFEKQFSTVSATTAR